MHRVQECKCQDCKHSFYVDEGKESRLDKCPFCGSTNYYLDYTWLLESDTEQTKCFDHDEQYPDVEE